jgi:hypothetical protein
MNFLSSPAESKLPSKVLIGSHRSLPFRQSGLITPPLAFGRFGDQFNYGGSNARPRFGARPQPIKAFIKRMWGTPQKNLSWAGGWGIAGLIALVAAPILPHLAFGMFVMAGLHATVAVLQLFSNSGSGNTGGGDGVYAYSGISDSSSHSSHHTSGHSSHSGSHHDGGCSSGDSGGDGGGGGDC